MQSFRSFLNLYNEVVSGSQNALAFKVSKKILVWKIWLKWWWSHKTRTMDEMQLETRNWAKLCKNVLFTTRTLSSSVLKFWICFTAEIAASFDFTHFSLSWILWDLSSYEKRFRSQSCWILHMIQNLFSKCVQSKYFDQL